MMQIIPYIHICQHETVEVEVEGGSTSDGMVATKRSVGLASRLLLLILLLLQSYGWVSGCGGVPVVVALVVHSLLWRALFLYTTTPKTFACEYRAYPQPHHHQSLPLVEGVFAADDGRSVYFVALNKGGCLSELKYAQEFHSTTNESHHFVCGFPDGILVTSDFRSTSSIEMTIWNGQTPLLSFDIRCDIPACPTSVSYNDSGCPGVQTMALFANSQEYQLSEPTCMPW